MELEKNFESLHQSICKNIISKLNNKLEKYLIEALNKKGFEFKSKIELEKFVTDNCRCEDNLKIKQRIYFVNNIPFFLHNYEMIYEQKNNFDEGFKMSANYGTFAFL